MGHDCLYLEGNGSGKIGIKKKKKNPNITVFVVPWWAWSHVFLSHYRQLYITHHLSFFLTYPLNLYTAAIQVFSFFLLLVLFLVLVIKNEKKLLDVLNSLFFLVKVIQFLCYTEVEKSDAIFFTWILVKKSQWL